MFKCLTRFIFLIASIQLLNVNVTHAQNGPIPWQYANDLPDTSIENAEYVDEPFGPNAKIALEKVVPKKEEAKKEGTVDKQEEALPGSLLDKLQRAHEYSVPSDFDKEYYLRIGDKLQMSVYGEAGTYRNVIVDPSGSLSYLMINSLFVVGKPIDAVRHEIQEELKNYYRYPLVLMTLVDNVKDHYVVLGEINIPGKKPVIGNPTITTGLSLSRGFTTRVYRDETVDMVDLDRSFLARDGEYIPVDFRALIEDGDMSQDLPLEAGDFIFIATKDTSEVYVLGEVNRQSEIDYFGTMTLTEAIAEAGGVTLRASSRVVVLRGALSCPTYFYIDYNRIVKAFACDFYLQPGDIVYVPPRKFSVLREIIRSGITTFVNTVFSIAGSTSFIHLHGPVMNHGKPENPSVVVPTINVGSSGAVVVP